MMKESSLLQISNWLKKELTLKEPTATIKKLKEMASSSSNFSLYRKILQAIEPLEVFLNLHLQKVAEVHNAKRRLMMKIVKSVFCFKDESCGQLPNCGTRIDICPYMWWQGRFRKEVAGWWRAESWTNRTERLSCDPNSGWCWGYPRLRLFTGGRLSSGLFTVGDSGRWDLLSGAYSSRT